MLSPLLWGLHSCDNDMAATSHQAALLSLRSLQGIYGGFKPEKLPAVPGLEGALSRVQFGSSVYYSPNSVKAYTVTVLDLHL